VGAAVHTGKRVEEQLLAVKVPLWEVQYVADQLAQVGQVAQLRRVRDAQHHSLGEGGLGRVLLQVGHGGQVRVDESLQALLPVPREGVQVGYPVVEARVGAEWFCFNLVNNLGFSV
jgi:hypothetical protein